VVEDLWKILLGKMYQAISLLGSNNRKALENDLEHETTGRKYVVLLL